MSETGTATGVEVTPSFGYDSNITIVISSVSALGVLMAVAFIASTFKMKKILPTDIIAISAVVSSTITAVILIIAPLTQACAAEAVAISLGILYQPCLHAVFAGIAEMKVSQWYNVGWKGAVGAVGTIAITGALIAAASLGSASYIVVPGGGYCFIVLWDFQGFLGLSIISIVACGAQALLYVVIYFHSRKTFIGIDEGFISSEPEEPIFGVPQEIKISIALPNKMMKTTEDLRRQTDHKRKLVKIKFRAGVYVLIAWLPVVSVLILDGAGTDPPIVLLYQIFIACVAIQPAAIVAAYGYVHPTHRRNIFRCFRAPRDSNASGASQTSSHSTGATSKMVPTIANTNETKQTPHGPTQIELEDGLKLSNDPETKVPTLKGLKPSNLLSIPKGEELALRFSIEKNMLLEENIFFVREVREYKELCKATNKSAAYERGKIIVRDFLANGRTNVGAPMRASIIDTFRPVFKFVKGTEFDGALTQIYGMLDDKVGFMGQFLQSPYMHELAHAVASTQKRLRADAPEILVYDLVGIL